MQTHVCGLPQTISSDAISTVPKLVKIWLGKCNYVPLHCDQHAAEVTACMRLHNTQHDIHTKPLW